MQTLLARHRKSVLRFAKYAVVGGSTFGFDLLLLYIVTQYAGVPYYIATPGAFLIAVSLNYLISRRFVFRGTKRTHTVGYSVFIGIALVAATITTLSTALFVTLGMHFLVARTTTAVCVGIGNYLLNLFFNFKVVGLHH